jgi:hypothetical protein
MRSMIHYLLIISAAVLLSFCSHSPTIRFQDEKAENMQGLEEAAAEYGLSLDLLGIYGLSKDVVFLFGGLVAGPVTLRSVLLRSNDGGQHWYEVMRPEAGSEIIEILFMENGNGWALVLWTIEGPGPAHLYYTDDYGESWRKLSDIPLDCCGPHSYPVGLQYKDNLNGSLRIFDPNNEECCYYETADTGMTWKKTGECSTIDPCRSNKPVEFVAKDGSEWRIESRSDSAIEINRRLSPADAWIAVSSIPIQFKYIDGKITAP